MQIGFFAIGIGPSADPELLALAARAVEQCEFHSLWTGEHVVLVSQYASKYPYAQDGRMPLPTTKVDFLDPFATLTFAAAHTKTVRLGTGICLVPEHNPVVLAKQVASLDKLSGGRFDFGVGIGWRAEEFAAVGVPWERRAGRPREDISRGGSGCGLKKSRNLRASSAVFQRSARTRNQGKSRTRRLSSVARAGRRSSGWVRWATVGSA